MPKPSGNNLKPYTGKEIVATQVVNGEEQKVHTGQDARTILELRTGPQGQEDGPALEPFRPAWGFSKLYSAWKALKEDPSHPLPEWDEYLDGLTSDAAAADAFINGKEQFLTLEPTVISPSHDDANSLINNEIVWSQIVNNVSKIEEYARREEFLPPDASVREDYRALTDVLRNAVREGETLVRMAVWLEQIERDPDMVALLSRRNTSGMTKAQRDFWNAYRVHRAEESGSVNKNKMLSAVVYWTQSAELDGEILEYAWGDGAGDLAGSLKGFSTDYAGGADRANAWLLYYSLIRSGIDPDSMVPFLQNLRDSGLKQRMENREYDEAVLHLAAWKEDDARDISRFAQELTAASEAGNLSPTDRERLLRDRLSDPAALSESARQTLAANFDRTFNKYFSSGQMEDGSAFSHLPGEGA